MTALHQERTKATIEVATEEAKSGVGDCVRESV
jgi:hypothetical protein